MTEPSTTITIAGFKGDIETVKDGLKSDSADDRVAALGASLRLKILTADRLRPYFDDPSLNVRYRAVELSCRLPDGDKLLDSLVSCLDDADLAEVAAFTLGEVGVAIPAVEGALVTQAKHHTEALCREAAVASLGALGVGRQTVLDATGDIATVRRRAILALAAFEGPEVDAALAKALEDRDWQVRQAAEDLGASPDSP